MTRASAGFRTALSESAIKVTRTSHLYGCKLNRQRLSRTPSFFEHQRGVGVGRIQITATRESRGRSSLSSSSRLPPRSGAMRLIPVTLPPAAPKLTTRPLPNGSPAFAITIGMVADARFAASGARVPIARITSTLRLTSSAASSGKRSRLLSREPRLERYILAFSPAQLLKRINQNRPSLRSEWCPRSEDSNPINPCRAAARRAASHAAAAPLMNVMNSRRFIGFPTPGSPDQYSRSEPCIAAKAACSCPRVRVKLRRTRSLSILLFGFAP